jgi:hypothetical protein
MHSADIEAEPQFTRPMRQTFTMLGIILLVGTGAWLAHEPILEVILSNLYLNAVIVGVFVIGVVTCFWQVLGLTTSVSWVENFAADRAGHEYDAVPRLLTSLATLLKARSARMHLSASSSRSILDSMATRLDETREITRYIINLLIFLGLLGTFYGLATTVPAVVATIKSLAPAEGGDLAGAEVFERLLSGLESQLGGMGTAFSSSLLGLAGSLVVGLLDLFAGHAQNRFYRELEEWLSTITRVGFASEDGGATGGIADFAGSGSFDLLAVSVEEMHRTFLRTETIQQETSDRIGALAKAVNDLNARVAQQAGGGEAVERAIVAESQLLQRIAESQEKVVDLMSAEAEEPTDAESRMRLRSIDVQLLRILEEMSAGRQDTVAELRADIAALNKTLRSMGRKPPSTPQSRS